METYTFWKLLDKYKIEIPIIQREYAQGRIEDKVNTIRTEFVQSIVKEITNKASSSMHLGFVYGKIFGKTKHEEIKRNKEAIENVLSSVKSYAKHLNINIHSEINDLGENKEDFVPNFIPLDGQQRLTTLFLTHWYLAQFTDKETHKNAMNKLSRFQYKSRKNALEFCHFITSVDLQKTALEGGASISEKLKTNTDFFKIWEKDSTVQGMLNMLDEIELQLIKREDKKELFAILKNAIPFDFLDLNELNQTDELYVKMNARGKHLSVFENFKARLIKYVNETKSIKNNLTESNWKKNLDKKWLDMFWQSNSIDSKIDDIIYQAFRKLNSYLFIAKTEEVNENFVKLIREDKFFSFKDFIELNFFDEQSLNFVFNSLNHLNNIKHIERLQEALKEIYTDSFVKDTNINQYLINKKISMTMPEEVYHFAFLLYLNTPQINEKDIDLEIFKTWMRICRNLIFNTYIQKPIEYIRAIKSIYILSQHLIAIKDYVKKPSNKISFFDNEQRIQEALKLSLFDLNDSWKEEILKTENHDYFIGDIGFILNFSKDDDDSYNIHQFKHYSDITSVLYSQEMLQRKDRIFYRALLSKGDYLPHVSGNNYTFCLPSNGSLRIRKDNWRKFFSSEKVRFLEQLIDDNISDVNTIQKDLKNVVKNYKENSWERFVIECPETIDYTFQGVGHIWCEMFEEILLLKTSKKYGYHVELRSYNFYKKNKIKEIKQTFFNAVKYESNTTVGKHKYDYPLIFFSRKEKNEQELHLEITFKDNHYYIQFAEAEARPLKSKALDKYFINWNCIDNKYSLQFESEKKLKDCLEDTIDSLSKLNIS